VGPQGSTISTPEPDEDAVSYCHRLESDGHEEMAMRSALRAHFNMPLAEMGSFFEQFPQARLRHVARLKVLQPNRTRYSLIKKVAKNLGVSDERAEYWIDR
jgi:hypothetical protein